MKLKLDDLVCVGIPDESQWGEYFAAWFDELVEILGAKHEKFDREDAVVQAFVKLMARGDDWNDAPETEKELFGCIMWQAKSALSHSYEKKDTEVRHAKAAIMDGYLLGRSSRGDSLDGRVRKAAAFATLLELCGNAGMKSVNVDAYCRCYLFGEETAVVAEALGIKANNIHQIKSRIEKLLTAKGPECYKKHRRRLFLAAA